MSDIMKQATDHAYSLMKQKKVLLRGYDNLLEVLLSPNNVTKQELLGIIRDTLKKAVLE